MGLHAFQGILRSPQKARLCNPCLRYELSPFTQERHCDQVWAGFAATATRVHAVPLCWQTFTGARQAGAIVTIEAVEAAKDAWQGDCA